MNYIAECLEKFQALDDNVRAELGAGTAYLALKDIEEETGLHLAFVLILWAIDELGENDLPEYLQGKYKLSPDKAQNLSARIINEVFDPAVERIAAFEMGAIPSGTTSYDALNILSIFQGGLLALLKGPASKIKDFNVAVFAALDKDPELEERIINALYTNKEIVSKDQITTEGKEHRPTIANWIKDFVVENGSGLFDGLALAKYLSTSPNCQHLGPEDKAMVSKVLKTYRNLVFFPESMDNVPLELWEVLPIENENGIQDVLADDAISDRPLPKNRVAAKPSVAVKKEVAPKIESKEAEQPTAEELTAAKLQAALNDYSAGSLEYKVIKQELERLRMTVASRR